jgi:hypothetical protein
MLDGGDVNPILEKCLILGDDNLSIFRGRLKNPEKTL